MLEAVLRQAERDSGAHLARLQRYIRQPSIAAENRGIDETASVELMNGYVGGGSPPEDWAVKALLATFSRIANAERS
jgi:hypothetical protein